MFPAGSAAGLPNSRRWGDAGRKLDALELALLDSLRQQLLAPRSRAEQRGGPAW